MKNKRGDWTLEKFLNILLAVVGIGILGYLAVSMIGIALQKTAIEQASATLGELVPKIENFLLQDDVEEDSHILQSPEGWIFNYYSMGYSDIDGRFPKPSSCGKESCFCICPGDKIVNCNEGVCKKTDQEKVGDRILIIRPGTGIKIDIKEIYLWKEPGYIFISDTREEDYSGIYDGPSGTS